MAEVELEATGPVETSTLPPRNRKAVVRNDFAVIPDVKEVKRRAVLAANTYLMHEGSPMASSFRSLAVKHGASNVMAVKREVDRLREDATEASNLREIGKLIRAGEVRMALDGETVEAGAEVVRTQDECAQGNYCGSGSGYNVYCQAMKWATRAVNLRSHTALQAVQEAQATFGAALKINTVRYRARYFAGQEPE